ncbi:unnamed protein product [Cuscuta epithymum]|uniref:Transcription factor MYC/MYB N-terminal domain-containing protein n=2 Tax=Cuscuta epithymum TaxID=186058 RepID=A0AAV0DV49_9ASTE|nr:unnamed protein product [Cuscuta epithymum]
MLLHRSSRREAKGPYLEQERQIEIEREGKRQKEMVGSSGAAATERSKEAVGMMALHEALRSVCLTSSDWTYSVFWTIRPRPRVRGGNGCKVGDESGSLMLMWEDGFCRGRVAECMGDMEGEDLVRKAFSKMSIQLMGKVASDKCHKWVFKEPTECEPNISNYWQSSFDALPQEWSDQFESGIQTIAVIQAGHGLLQLGSCKIIPEDLHFVLRMRHTFESLGYQSGFYLSQLFSSTRNATPHSSSTLKQPNRPLPPPFNWSMSSTPSVLSSPSFQNSVNLGIPPCKDDSSSSHMFLLPHSSSEPRMEGMIRDQANDIKWPNGLSFFSALAGGRADDDSPGRLLFNPENRMDQSHHNEFLSLDCHYNPSPHRVRHLENNKFKRSYTLPARMVSSSSSTSLDLHPMAEYRGDEAAGMCSDVMEHFLD